VNPASEFGLSLSFGALIFYCGDSKEKRCRELIGKLIGKGMVVLI
jgi:hypothetical protein